jgi:uncharacterized ferredoxin-like protein
MDCLRCPLCVLPGNGEKRSGGQLFIKRGSPFIETVIVEDKDTLKRLADWLRNRGQKHKQPIWFSDTDTAEKLDLVLFIGLSDWCPPQYDYGACGYGTCAEFLQARPKHALGDSRGIQRSCVPTSRD